MKIPIADQNATRLIKKDKKLLKSSFYSITDCDEDTQQFADNKKVKKAIKILTKLKKIINKVGNGL